MILAGIDIGTNTLRLLVADADRHSFRILHSARTITRLGEQLDRTGMLSTEARLRSLGALQEFAAAAGRFRPEAVAAIGTSALRNAGNSAEFIGEVRAKTGISIRVVEGAEEARLTLLGVEMSIRTEPALVTDIGGGSTEIINPSRSEERSLPLGAVYLTERFLKHDPPLITELDALRSEIRSVLARGAPRSGSGPLVGTAGTITTLASMDLQMDTYDPERITGHILRRSAVGRLIGLLSRSAVAERRSFPGLESGREDIILAGGVVAEEIMDHYGFSSMLVSDWGLREGIVIDLYDRITTGAAHWDGPLKEP